MADSHSIKTHHLALPPSAPSTSPEPRATPVVAAAAEATPRAPSTLRNVYVGTAGWALSHVVGPGAFPGQPGLPRYAQYFNAVEVNSTFYRLPRAGTIARWRDTTPASFRFAVKVPRAITHEARLVDVERELEEFCALVAHFESKLGPLLVQLPPSFEFDAELFARLFANFARLTSAQVVFEPRHLSCFSTEATALLAEHGIARVAADPACCPTAASINGASRVAYFRWHGAPRMYFSAYPPEALHALSRALLEARGKKGARGEVYCFFDNTALGAAAVNALALKADLVSQRF